MAGLSTLSYKVGGGDELERVAKRVSLPEGSERFHRGILDLDVFLLAADLDDLGELDSVVRLGGDDDHAVEQIDGDAVGRLVVRAADAGDASVRGDDDDGGERALQGADEPREALDVEHVHLVDEEHAGHDVRLALLAPVGDAQVDLVADLGLDLARVAGEERPEALLARVDDVDLVQRDRVDDLLALAELALGRGHEARGRGHGVVVLGAHEAAAELGDLARGLVDGDDVRRPGSSPSAGCRSSSGRDRTWTPCRRS